ncbi:hypothetical protein SAMN05216188_11615 [Lentzea xinjiangensis]|uniref:DUF2690 domain-containing protein n=1 Tax=Lentzea xinjiangensis TaxID=402600 RepID=A0A1H9SAV5_9PSEU|nr:hypothetical protein [Lentzea xinjiangensis]SER82150.1 hypothetical protein SAMN05216188_11615 [Lentzea xinjiangensis]
MRRRIGAAVLAAAAVAVTCASPAQAETNPKCPSGVTQIGATKYIKSGSATVASVKQFKGCDKNWGYVYVWDSWKAGHPKFRAAAGIMTRTSEGPLGYSGGDEGDQEAWSNGSNTLSVCTRAYGSVVSADYMLSGLTEERC